MKPTILLLFLLPILTIVLTPVCKGQTSQNEENQKTNTIHVQFIDKPTFNSQMNIKTGRGMSKATYLILYDDLESEAFEFEELKVKKVANYTTQSNQVIVRRYLGYFEFQDFLVHTGDSLVISYDKEKPLIIKHSFIKYAPQDFNVEAILNKKYTEAYTITGKSTDTKMASFQDFYNDPKQIAEHQKRNGTEKAKYIETLEIQANKRLLPSIATLQKNAQLLLDSLLNTNQISQHVYEFYQHKYANILLKVEIMSGVKDSIGTADKINNLFTQRNHSDEYTNLILESFEKQLYDSKVPWTLSDQFNLRDIRESFNLIKKSTLLNPKVKERLLFLNLDKIANYFPDDVDQYLKSFLAETTDSLLVKKAQQKFQKDTAPINIPSDLHLLTINQSQITIEELLQNNKGKVLYLDFWASWCAPCIEEMKHSLALRQKYAKRDVEVIFLSLDDNFSKWEKASIRQGLNSVKNSFKILKPEDSKFMSEFKIQTIPRYMIIDKSGKIINANALRPSSPKIIEVIDDLLMK